jgi:high-affinity iron transporter
MTNLLLLIGAGLFSKAVGEFEGNAYAKLLGAQGDDALGDGPGSYRVQGNVWHLACCSPNDNLDGQGWSIFGAIFGWSNNGSRKPSLYFYAQKLTEFLIVGTILSYVFYWIAVIATLVFLKFKEVRLVPPSLLTQLTHHLTSPGPNETLRERINSRYPPSKLAQGKGSVTRG